VGKLSLEHKLGCFISGLKDTIRIEVQASRPASLTAAVGLARLYEAKQHDQRRGPLSETRKNSNLPPMPSSTLIRAKNPQIKKLTPEEMKDRREKGLCFNCDEKYLPGHRCAKLFWLELQNEEEGPHMGRSNLDNPEIFEEEEPAISLHAITGIQGPRTMRLRGVVSCCRIVLLVDSGSTHNFISSTTARKLGITPACTGKMEVLVANGEKLSSGGVCRGVTICLGEYQFTVDFYVLEIEGCEAVLGAVWLRTLGPILWDFSSMWMSFLWRGNKVFLQGISIPKDKIVDGPNFLKLLRGCLRGVVLQLKVVHLGDKIIKDEEVDSDIQILLKQYSALFQEPKGLPPSWAHDHKIPVIPGKGPVSVRPYRYPFYQKNEIEKQVSNLLSSGVVRVSTSPYSSPVLLVKKHDGSWRLCVEYRALNQITVKDKFPILVIDELLDELHGA
jgi:hypothetical protein